MLSKGAFSPTVARTSLKRDEDTDLGLRDKRGFWKPNEIIKYSPLLKFPIRFYRVHKNVLLKWDSFFLFEF